MILVTGATGKFGGCTAHFLQQKGITFRAAARHQENLDNRFAGKIPTVAFDWDQPGSFRKALEGITIVSIMPPPVTTADFHIRLQPFIEAAKEAGVRHLVLTTALYADEKDSLFYHTEALVRNAGIPHIIIRPSFVFQNFLHQFLEQVRNGLIVAPSGTGRTPYVDLRNVGEATSVLLQHPEPHSGKTYSITGPEPFTHQQMANILSAALSKPIIHISPSHHEYKHFLTAAHVPEFLHHFLLTLYATIAKGQWDKTTNDYWLLTGKQPTSFTQFVQEYLPLFAPSAVIGK